MFLYNYNLSFCAYIGYYLAFNIMNAILVPDYQLVNNYWACFQYKENWMSFEHIYRGKMG